MSIPQNADPSAARDGQVLAPRRGGADSFGWDDLHLDTHAGATIEDKSDGASYYASTWRNIGFFGGAATTFLTFQSLMVCMDTTICGFAFHAGDIAFSYDGNVLPASGDCTIGINKGDSVGFAVLPGTTNGIVSRPS